jgi:hypothetical protein
MQIIQPSPNPFKPLTPATILFTPPVYPPPKSSSRSKIQLTPRQLAHQNRLNRNTTPTPASKHSIKQNAQLADFTKLSIEDQDEQVKNTLYSTHRNYQNEIIDDIADLIHRYDSNERNLNIIIKNFE